MPVKTKKPVKEKLKTKVNNKKVKSEKLEIEEIELDEEEIEDPDVEEEIIKEITPKKKVVVQKPKMADIDDFLNSLEEERYTD